MKVIIIIVVFVVAAVAVIYFSPTAPPRADFKPQILDSQSYEAAAVHLENQIHDLSPTPPTENTWTIREVEFVKDEPYAYVVYHDTHNIFRILIETGQNDTFRTVAAFEAADQGWRLSRGEDLAKGKETVNITPSN